MHTAEKLHTYYQDFSPSTLEHVAGVHDRMHSLRDYDQVLAAAGIHIPKLGLLQRFQGQHILDVRPKEHDPSHALFVQTEMAQPFDPNNLYKIAGLALTFPNTRIIAKANPSAGRFWEKGIPVKQLKHIWDGDYSPVTAPLAGYIERAGLETGDAIGGSLAADLTAALATQAPCEIKHAIYIEPSSLTKRPYITLGKAFASTNGPLTFYVAENELPTFIDARSDSINSVEFYGSFTRPSTLAIAAGIAKGRFMEQAYRALNANPHMRTTFAWGTASELAENEVMKSFAAEYAHATQKESTKIIPLAGQKHALVNFIALTNAIAYESIAA